MDSRAASWCEHTLRIPTATQAELATLKRRSALSVSVVIPARDEASTIASIITSLRANLMTGPAAIVDELVVIDSDSTDDTARVAQEAGAKVFAACEIESALGSTPGKGEAMWKSQFVTSGDLIVFLDADVTSFTPEYVIELLTPLLRSQEIALVKGFYDRVLNTGDAQQTGQGGRVTELTARPIIAMWWPELLGVIQPLGGEWAIRRDVFETLSVPCGYGVEIAVLIDVFEFFGADSIAQVDLGAREHRHQDLRSLSVMAAEVLAAAERRHLGRIHEPGLTMANVSRDEAGLHWSTAAINAIERPPVVEYRVASIEESEQRR